MFRGAVDSVVETLQRAEDVHGSDGFGDFHYPDAPDVDKFVQQEHAVNYLTRITSEHPGMCCTVQGASQIVRTEKPLFVCWQHEIFVTKMGIKSNEPFGNIS